MTEPTDLEGVAWELYGLPPGEFTAARTAAERAARASGDRGLAAAVKTLRRPPVAAWAVNRLVRERRGLVEQVVELGASLRQAQSQLQGDALRELTRQRRQLVAAVTTETRRLAADHGQRLADAAARQVEETLQAAMADEAAADAVLSGLLAEPLSSTGLESLGSVVAVGPAGGHRSAGEEPTAGRQRSAGGQPSPGAQRSAGRRGLSLVRDDGRRRREAEERVQAAGRAVRAAAKAHGAAVRKRDKAQARVLQIGAEIDELKRRLASLEESSDQAAAALEEREAAVEEAEEELAEAEAEAKAAAAALDTG